ncbi:MAG TPA: zinc-dependent alcohol dehydrogenase [Kofleriaceae bacterium]|nr:zinc-dependent alcohol dehydrogenase [Kofleriaceae bacterium]
MRAVCWYGPRDLRVQEVADPAIVQPHDAIVRVTLSAICGSDLHLYNGFMPGMRKGDILGHEFMGEVIEVGSAVEHIKPADRVVVMCGISCGRCWFCKHDLFSACDNSNPSPSADVMETMYGHAGAALFGYSHVMGGYSGGQAELVRVPFADVGCLVLPAAPASPTSPASVEAEKVLLVSDILPTGWMAAESCGIQPGDIVAVFGCGPVGQLSAISALAQGAERVIAIDRVQARLDMAGRNPRVTALDAREGRLLARLDALTGGRGPDACIDAVGLEADGDGPAAIYDKVKQKLRAQSDRPTALRMAIQACRKGGTVSIPGVYGGLIDKFPMGAAFGKGLTLKMGQTHFHRYGKPLLDKVLASELDPSFIVTHRVGLDDAPDAYRMFNAKADGCVKVVMRP